MSDFVIGNTSRNQNDYKTCVNDMARVSRFLDSQGGSMRVFAPFTDAEVATTR